MVVDSLKPSSVYIFQVKHTLKKENTFEKRALKKKIHCVFFTLDEIFAFAASQVRARTSAGYGAFSRRFEFQTSPYCEYPQEKERQAEHTS